MTKHYTVFDNQLGDISESSEADLKYPTQEVEREMVRLQQAQEITIDGQF